MVAMIVSRVVACISLLLVLVAPPTAHGVGIGGYSRVRDNKSHNLERSSFEGVINARRGRAHSPTNTSKHDSLEGHMHTSHDDPASMNIVWSRNISDTPDPSDGPSLVGLATVLPPKGHADALSTTFLLTRPPFPPTGTINHCESTVTAIDATGAVTWQTPQNTRVRRAIQQLRR